MSQEQSPIVMVTGASKGIGKGIAEVFANAGARLALVARSKDALTEFATTYREKGIEAEVIVADITDRASMAAAVEKTVEIFGGLDVLCANAGIFPAASLETMTDDDWDTVMDTNLKGTFISVQAAMPALKTSAFGRVIVTSSITGPVTGYPGWAHYGASKAGQLGFIRTAAIELAKYNITINAVMPGNILTEGLEDMGDDYLASMSASIPMKRLGSTADIGHAVRFFASPEAGYITGQTLIVDGGQILPESLDAVG